MCVLESVGQRVLQSARNRHGGAPAVADGILAKGEVPRFLRITVIAGELDPGIGHPVVFAQLFHSFKPIAGGKRNEPWSNAEVVMHKSFILLGKVDETRFSLDAADSSRAATLLCRFQKLVTGPVRLL